MTPVLIGRPPALGADRPSASDLMARTPFVVTSALSVVELRHRFRHAHARHAVVVDGDLCVGLVDRHDLEAAMAGDARAPQARNLRHLVSVTPAVGPDTGLAGVHRALAGSPRGAVLVLDDDGRLLGLVTAADLPAPREGDLPC